MANREKQIRQLARNREAGLSLLELMASVFVLVIAGGIVVGALIGMTRTQGTISNRTEMHSSIRSATELLEQEIGQAGSIAVPGAVTTAGAISGGAPSSQTITLTSTASGNATAGMFVGEFVTVDSGYIVVAGQNVPLQETVALTAVTSSQITAVFNNPNGHVAGVSVVPLGGFASGVVPPSMANGSSPTILKIFGNINGDGNMVYVEYKCDTTAGNLYRNSMPFDAASKPALTSGLVLLPNILANPAGAPCFTYQTKTVNGVDYVIDVAVTLTAQTQVVDPQTGAFQQETKALLNVSPRNVFEVYNIASLPITNRTQPTPPSVISLLP